MTLTGLEEKAGKLPPTAEFTDFDAASTWAKNAISLAKQVGFIGGIANGDGTFRFGPKQNADWQALAKLTYQFVVNKSTYIKKAEEIYNNTFLGTIEKYDQNYGKVVFNNGKDFIVTSDLKDKIFTKQNLNLLLGSTISYELNKENEISAITKLTLTAAGKAAGVGKDEFSANIVFDGNNAIINGDVIVKGDYTTLQNLTIKGDLYIDEAVENDFLASNVTVEGTTYVNGGDDNTVVFNNGKMQSVKVNKQEVKVAIGKDTSIESAVMTGNNAKFVLEDENAVVNSVSIQSNAVVEGKGKINEVVLDAKDAKVTLNTTEKVEKVTVKEAGTTIEGTSKIGEVVVEKKDAKVTLNSTQGIDKVSVKEAGTTVEGTGKITEVVVEKKDAEITLNTTQKIEKVTAKAEGTTIKGSTEVTTVRNETGNTDAVKVDLDKAPEKVEVVEPSTIEETSESTEETDSQEEGGTPSDNSGSSGGSAPVPPPSTTPSDPSTPEVDPTQIHFLFRENINNDSWINVEATYKVDNFYRYTHSLTSTVEDNEEGLILKLSNINWEQADTYYLAILAGGHVYRYDIKEENEGQLITLDPDDSYITLDLEVPNVNLVNSDISLTFIDENENNQPLVSIHNVQTGYRIPAGIYNIQVTVEEDTSIYSLLKTDCELSSVKNKIEFAEDEISQYTLNNDNLKLDHIIGFGPHGKFSSTSGVGSEVESSNYNLYLSNNTESLGVVFKISDTNLTFSFEEPPFPSILQFDSALQFKVSEKAGVNLNNVEGGKKLRDYLMDINVYDSLNNYVERIWKYENGYQSFGGKVEFKNLATNEIESSNVPYFTYWSIGDVSIPTKPGTYEVTFSVVDSPIPVTSKTITMTVSDVLPKTEVTIAQGFTIGSTKLNGHTSNPGNIIKYKLSDTEVVAPKIGDIPPEDLTTYQLGNDIVNVSSGKYIVIYEFNSDNQVVSFAQIQINDEDIRTRLTHRLTINSNNVTIEFNAELAEATKTNTTLDQILDFFAINDGETTLLTKSNIASINWDTSNLQIPKLIINLNETINLGDSYLYDFRFVNGAVYFDKIDTHADYNYGTSGQLSTTTNIIVSHILNVVGTTYNDDFKTKIVGGWLNNLSIKSILSNYNSNNDSLYLQFITDNISSITDIASLQTIINLANDSSPTDYLSITNNAQEIDDLFMLLDQNNIYNVSSAIYVDYLSLPELRKSEVINQILVQKPATGYSQILEIVAVFDRAIQDQILIYSKLNTINNSVTIDDMLQAIYDVVELGNQNFDRLPPVEKTMAQIVINDWNSLGVDEKNSVAEFLIDEKPLNGYIGGRAIAKKFAEGIFLSKFKLFDISNNMVELEFMTPNNATSITISLSDGTTVATDEELTVSSKSTKILNLSSNTEYEFKLDIVGGPYEEDYYYPIITQGHLQDLRVIPDGNSIELTFTAPTGASSIELWQTMYINNEWTPWVELSVEPPLNEESNTIIVTDIQPDTLYAYQLYLYDGIYAGDSNIVTIYISSSTTVVDQSFGTVVTQIVTTEGNQSITIVNGTTVDSLKSAIGSNDDSIQTYVVKRNLDEITGTIELQIGDILVVTAENGAEKVYEINLQDKSAVNLQNINSAVDVAGMRGAIEDPSLSLDLTIYNQYSDQKKNLIAYDMLNKKPKTGYSTIAEIQTDLDNSVIFFTNLPSVLVETISAPGEVEAGINGDIAFRFYNYQNQDKVSNAVLNDSIIGFLTDTSVSKLTFDLYQMVNDNYTKIASSLQMTNGNNQSFVETLGTSYKQYNQMTEEVFAIKIISIDEVSVDSLANTLSIDIIIESIVGDLYNIYNFDASNIPSSETITSSITIGQ